MTQPHEDLILELIGRGSSRDDIFEDLRIGVANGLAGYFLCATPGDLEQLLRGMEQRGLIVRDGWDWKRRPPKAKGVLFA